MDSHATFWRRAAILEKSLGMGHLAAANVKIQQHVDESLIDE
jgi:hypothetical protein